MGKNAEGYTGLPCWRVLEKDSDGSVLLLSEYLWKGDGTEAGELIQQKEICGRKVKQNSGVQILRMPCWQTSLA